MVRMRRMMFVMMVLAVICTIAMVILVPYAMAAGQRQDPITGVPEIDQVLAATGLGVIIMLVIEALKRGGLVPDGQAGAWMAIAGALAYLLLLVLGVFDIDLASPDAQVVIALLTQLAQLALTIISGLGSFGLLRQGEILNKLPGRS